MLLASTKRLNFFIDQMVNSYELRDLMVQGHRYYDCLSSFSSLGTDDRSPHVITASAQHHGIFPIWNISDAVLGRGHILAFRVAGLSPKSWKSRLVIVLHRYLSFTVLLEYTCFESKDNQPPCPSVIPHTYLVSCILSNMSQTVPLITTDTA